MGSSTRSAWSTESDNVLANSNHKRGDILHEFAMKAKTLEINPHSPLIEGLLRRIKDLPSDEDEKDEEAEAELKEVTSILVDGALVRSGFDVQNKNQYVSSIYAATIPRLLSSQLLQPC